MIAAALATLAIGSFGGTSPAESLAWADRLYRQASALPSRYESRNLSEVQGAYAAIIRKYGPTPLASRGIARCLARSGEAQLATLIYRRIPPSYVARGEVSRAEEAANVAIRIEADARGWSMLKVVPLVGSDRRWWAAVVAKVEPEKTEFATRNRIPRFQLRLYRADIGLNGPTAVHVTSSLAFDNDITEDVGLISAYVDGTSKPALVLERCLTGLDASPTELYFVQKVGERLKITCSFSGILPFDVHVPKGQGLVFGTTEAKKIWWPDYYEWRGGRFVFANRQHPAFYEPEVAQIRADLAQNPTNFGHHLRAAAVAMCRAKPIDALRSLREAERLCRLSIAARNGGWQENVDSSGPLYYGDYRENLKQILQRIAWVRRRDFNHVLLYRPYDSDLLVRPYKLGHAGDGMTP